MHRQHCGPHGLPLLPRRGVPTLRLDTDDAGGDPVLLTPQLRELLPLQQLPQGQPDAMPKRSLRELPDDDTFLPAPPPDHGPGQAPPPHRAVPPPVPPLARGARGAHPALHTVRRRQQGVRDGRGALQPPAPVGGPAGPAVRRVDEAAARKGARAPAPREVPPAAVLARRAGRRHELHARPRGVPLRRLRRGGPAGVQDRDDQATP
mmetsp:Transcript_127660/g.361277  ORF Transcript_127660/g.361277 Transcript_127660/m.361277 type:complete len:206 (+) Transcript_127660:692-1309(+)